ncbi:membrane protein insertion efficiency factor YidD [Nakamurella silvestris]|nr:membrane protein insertion efficiency factor YidD [Nakamurella silvestris]
MKPSWPARVLLLPIRGYQRFISPALPPTCRFYPTCSAYAVQAITEHGALRGFWLALRRLGRCHPFHAGGIDHVPPRKVSARSRKKQHQTGDFGSESTSSIVEAPGVMRPSTVQRSGHLDDVRPRGLGPATSTG